MNINRSFQKIMRILSPSSIQYFLVQFAIQLRLYLFFAALLAGVYPIVLWVVGQLLFPFQANGSLIVDQKGRVRGSTLLAQNFAHEKFLRLRPSSHQYDAQYPQASLIGPLQPQWREKVKHYVLEFKNLQSEQNAKPIPGELITHSGSGLEPFMSLASFELQMVRVSGELQMNNSRHFKPSDLAQLQQQCASGGFWGPRVINGMCVNSWIAGIPPH